jgi:hypothetical protein
MNLPNGCTRPTGDTLDLDGYCVMSGLLPDSCGLACHRNLPDVPIVHDAWDDGRLG